MKITTISGELIEIQNVIEQHHCPHLQGITLSPFSDIPIYTCDACGTSLTQDQVKFIWKQKQSNQETQ